MIININYVAYIMIIQLYLKFNVYTSKFNTQFNTVNTFSISTVREQLSNYKSIIHIYYWSILSIYYLVKLILNTIITLLVFLCIA